jgi:hypothetical protein
VTDYITQRQARAEGSVDIRAWIIFAVVLIAAAQAFWATH